MKSILQQFMFKSLLHLKHAAALIAFLIPGLFQSNVMAQTYCSPVLDCTFGDLIDNFSFNTLTNNGTGCNNTTTGYSFITSKTTTVAKGQTYALSMQSGTQWQQGFGVWIDYNQDGDFNDAGEFVYASPTYATTTFSTTITIPANAKSGKTRLRVVALYFSTVTSNQNCITTGDYGEAEDYEITILASAPNDVGVASIDSPQTFCPGTYAVKATIQNYGTNKIDTVTVNWSIDGSPQSAINYYSTLDTIGGPGNSSAQITLGNVVFAAGTPKTIKVWTSGPNNKADTINNNDTIQKSLGAAISGTFTVGGTGADYSTLSAAVADLNNFGVCGPVTINISSGTYSGQVLLNNITGASASNTITFKGAGIGNTILTHSATSTANLATVQLNGSDYVRFSDMTIAGTNASNGVGILLTNKADYNDFRRIRVEMNTTSTSATTAGIAVTASTTSPSTYGDAGNYNVFDSITVLGAYYGLRFNGTGTSTAHSYGNQILNSEFTQQYYYGIMPYYQNEVVVHNNTVHNFRNTINYGIYVYYSSDITVTNNIVKSNYEALRLYYINQYLSNNLVSKVHNNLLYSAGSYYTMYNYYSNNLKFHHNTLVGSYATGTAYIYNNLNLDAQNNIFVNRQSGATSNAVYLFNGSYINFDHNIYHTSGGTFIYHNAAIANLAAWQAAFPALNANSRVVNPPFVSATDLHLDPTVSFFRGPNVGVSDDVDSETRCAFAPTIGADESKYPEPTPVANFGVSDTIYVNSPVMVNNAAGRNEAKAHKWYVNGVYQTNALHYKHVSANTGVDTIKLVTQGCGGIDSISKPVVIVIPTREPMAAFIADKYVVDIFEGVQFTDLSDYGPASWEWHVSPAIYQTQFGPLPTYSFLNNTSDFSQNPVIAFENPGTYEICLVATNTQGSDTFCRTAYITVKATNLMCIFPFDTDVAAGTLYDDGGATGNYANNLNCNFLIAPCASDVTLILNEFELATGDFLRVYDGEDNKGTPLWDASTYPNGMTGNITNASVTSTLKANSGKMYIEFVTNASGNAAGFAAEWSSTPSAVPAPVADFRLPDTVCVGIPATFENLTTGSNVSYSWDADNDGNPESASENFTHTFPFTGTYDVTLTAENCGGADRITRQITVVAPTHAPNTGFYADITRPNIGEIVNFFDTTTYCTESYRWEITPNDYSFVNNTNAQSQNPQIVFEEPGYYDVKLVTSNVSGADSVVKQQYILAIQYCTPSVVNLNSDLGISRFVLNTINNSSKIGEAGYTDYTGSASTELEKGAVYTVTVERTSNNNPINRRVWIDFNQDGDFDDAGELVLSQSSSNSLSWTDTFIVPATALNGATRLRVATNFGSLSNTPCGPNSYGEYEDYRVILRPDVSAPVVTINGADTVTIEQCRSYTDAGATATDNVDGNLTSQISASGLPIDTCTIGLHTITYTVTDVQGNVGMAQRIVKVIADTTDPVLILTGNNPDTTMVHTAWTEPGYTATDNVGGNITSSVVVAGYVDTAIVGTYQLTYTVADAEGNTATAVRIVLVIDDVEPTITLTGADTIYVEVGGTFTDPGATATDNYDTALTVTVTGNVDVNTVGTYTLTYCTEDESGNRACTTRTIIVQDTEAPTVTLRGADTVNVEVYSTFIDPGLTITDNYSSTFTVTTSGTFNGSTNNLGDFTIVYEVRDGSGNLTTVTRIVRVVDTQAPVITLNGPVLVHLERWQDWTDPWVTVSDNYDNNPRVDTSTNFNGALLEGFYYITYWAVDQSGNKSTEVTRFIVVGESTSGIGSGSEVSVSVYPNPNNGRFVAELQLTKTENVHMAVTDMMGREISLIHNGNTNGGKFEVDLAGAKQGVYFIKVMAGEQLFIKKFVVIK